MKNATDEELVVSIVQGHSDAFSALYNRYKSKVMGYVFSKIKNQEASDEVFQVIWEKAYKSLPKFDTSRVFKSWLFAISLNSVNDYFRNNKVQLTSIDLVSEDEIVALKSSNIEEINFDSLPPSYKEIFIYKYREGFTTNEIARKMSLTDANVRKILSRGRNLLKKQLKEEK